MLIWGKIYKIKTFNQFTYVVTWCSAPSASCKPKQQGVCIRCGTNKSTSTTEGKIKANSNRSERN